VHPACSLEAFDLLVSTGRGLEQKCISALKEVVCSFDPDFGVMTSEFSGLLKGYATRPNRDIVRHIASVLQERPWYNELIKRAVPIDKVILNDPGQIVEAVKDLRLQIPSGDEESFRVRVRKRGAALDRMKLIAAVADLFDNRVDLAHPDFEVRIEMVGKLSGVSIIRRGEIFPGL
jgi:tRNA acetyltransferase TAN1